MTIRDKVKWLKEQHNVSAINEVIVCLGDIPKLRNLYDKWFESGISDFPGCNEGILLIELLYNITKNKSK